MVEKIRQKMSGGGELYICCVYPWALLDSVVLGEARGGAGGGLGDTLGCTLSLLRVFFRRRSTLFSASTGICIRKLRVALSGDVATNLGMSVNDQMFLTKSEQRGVPCMYQCVDSLFILVLRPEYGRA